MKKAVVNNAIGLITPPVGTVLNVVAGVGKVSMDDVMKGVWPFRSPSSWCCS